MSVDPEDSLKIELLEYLILGVIVALLLVLLFILRYLLTLKDKCPHFCCAWVPSAETKKSRSSTVSRPKFDKPTATTGLENDTSQLFN